MNHHIRNMVELAAMKTPPIKSIRWKSSVITHQSDCDFNPNRCPIMQAENRAQASRPAWKALETIYGREAPNDASFAMPAITREVDGSLTLGEVVELGGHEFDRLYPILSSGPLEVEGHTGSLTIYSNHRLGTKTDRWGFTEPLDYEFAMSNPTVTLTQFDDTTEMIGASGSLLDEAIANDWWAIQDSNPCHRLRRPA